MDYSEKHRMDRTLKIIGAVRKELKLQNAWASSEALRCLAANGILDVNLLYNIKVLRTPEEACEALTLEREKGEHSGCEESAKLVYGSVEFGKNSWSAGAPAYCAYSDEVLPIFNINKEFIILKSRVDLTHWQYGTDEDREDFIILYIPACNIDQQEYTVEFEKRIEELCNINLSKEDFKVKKNVERARIYTDGVFIEYTYNGDTIEVSDPWGGNRMTMSIMRGCGYDAEMGDYVPPIAVIEGITQDEWDAFESNILHDSQQQRLSDDEWALLLESTEDPLHLLAVSRNGETLYIEENDIKDVEDGCKVIDGIGCEWEVDAKKLYRLATNGNSTMMHFVMNGYYSYDLRRMEPYRK